MIFCNANHSLNEYCHHNDKKNYHDIQFLIIPKMSESPKWYFAIPINILICPPKKKYHQLNVMFLYNEHDMIFIHSFLKHFRQTKIACDSTVLNIIRKPHRKKETVQIIIVHKETKNIFSCKYIRMIQTQFIMT